MTHSVSTSSLFSTAFVAIALCATPLLAQEAATDTPPNIPPTESAASAQTVAATPGVRIVRLSEVNGDVQLDRQTGHGFEAAFANLPITQGGRLRTGEGVAEVEFEDNSSLRLTPHSLVEFPVLSLGSDGARSSTVHVVQGTIYVSLTKGKQNNVNVTFGKETLALGPSAHIELAVNDKQPRLDVLDGTVQAANGATTTTVGKKKALLFDPANSAPPTLLSKNEKGPFDEWDKHSVEYHQRLAPSGGNYASVPYSYGLADMNYYGGFTNMGGCGMMWQPYLVSANWSPFNNGTWAWYPGGGYSWVSPYPWGWTAFHSGSWNYCSGSGWGWQPGSQWNGIGNTPLVKSPKGPLRLRPPSRPHPLGPTIIAVNQKPLVASKLNDKDSFVFRRDSAGLGVPRGTFGKLNHISSGVVQHGSVERPAYVTPMSTGRPGNETGMAANHGVNGVSATHTMPTGSNASPGGRSASPGGSGAGSSGGRSMGPSGGGSFGGGGGHMGGGPSAGGSGHMGGGPSGGASSGGHH
ncbi:MAG: DUF6600 domain-containing protein [Candidatus Sulfotelmatobacter sp.]